MRHPTLNRRRFVRLAATGIAFGGIALLEACAPASAPSAPPTAASKPAPAAANPTAAPAKPTSPPAAPPTQASAAAPTIAPKPTAPPSVSRTVVLPNRFPVQGIKPDLAAFEALLGETSPELVATAV